MIVEMLNECTRIKVLKYVQIQHMSLHPRSTVYWKLIIIRAYIYHGRPDLFFNIQLAIAIYDSKYIYVDIFRIFLLMCCTMLAIFGCVQHFYFILCPLIFFIWVDLQNFLFLLTWRKILKWNLLRMLTWNLLSLTKMFIWVYIFERRNRYKMFLNTTMSI